MEEDVVEGFRKSPKMQEEVEDAWDLNASWAEPEKVAEAAAVVDVAAAAATACVALEQMWCLQLLLWHSHQYLSPGPDNIRIISVYYCCQVEYICQQKKIVSHP